MDSSANDKTTIDINKETVSPNFWFGEKPEFINIFPVEGLTKSGGSAMIFHDGQAEIVHIMNVGTRIDLENKKDKPI